LTKPVSEIDDEVEARKAEHLQVSAERDVNSRSGPGWADVHLAHESLPRADLNGVDLAVEFLGRRLQAPLVISAMTGGHAAAAKINAVLARAAERHGLAMGLGSQRAALRNPSLAGTYSVAREMAPDAFLIANLGAAQLVHQEGEQLLAPDQLRGAVEMLRADALAIHLNFLQESVQPEGDRRATGIREAIRAAVAGVEVPCIAKETGAGMPRRTALELADMGFRALDVSGAGGTSFAAVEAERAADRVDLRGATLGQGVQGLGRTNRGFGGWRRGSRPSRGGDRRTANRSRCRQGDRTRRHAGRRGTSTPGRGPRRR